MPNKNRKLTRLELMVCAWEDLMFVAQLRKQCYTSQNFKLSRLFSYGMGGMDHWKEFRKHLLSATNVEFDQAKFGQNLNSYTYITEGKRGPKETIDLHLPTGSITETIFGWMKSSRRVFSLSHDLQTLLGATSLDDVRVGDLRFPFEAFVVELAEPIVGKTGNNYDMILFGKIHDNRVGGLLIPDRITEYTPLSLKHKSELQKLAERKKWERLYRKLPSAERYLLSYNNMHTGFYWWCDHDLENLVTEQVSKHQQRIDRKMETSGRNTSECVNYHPDTAVGDIVTEQYALRVVAGLCLYLRTLPPNSPHKGTWEKVDIEPLRIPVQAITDESQICTISTEFVLSSEEQRVFRGSQVSEELAGSRKINPHFRRGFWRRPTGLGHDPTAEKTIWVRPTIVNQHLLKEGQLPLGANTILRSSE